jgi:hypothetical protein
LPSNGVSRVQFLFTRIDGRYGVTSQISLNIYELSVQSLIFPTSFAGNKIEKNELGGACGTNGGRERCALGFSGET